MTHRERYERQSEVLYSTLEGLQQIDGTWEHHIEQIVDDAQAFLDWLDTATVVKGVQTKRAQGLARRIVDERATLADVREWCERVESLTTEVETAIAEWESAEEEALAEEEDG
jgi:hypothetical protein